jgi:putative YhdH/YhfP family quinone oxidoreductase
MDDFACWMVEKGADGTIRGGMTRRPREELPPGDVLIAVSHSSLNYKDALAATGHPGVARHLPHVPGIDAVGLVAESADPRFAPGHEVLVTGYELGSLRWGGWSEFIRVPGDWVVPLPKGLCAEDAMRLGTAGFTAALSVKRLLENGLPPGDGEVLVTGATGGVGSLALSMLAGQGFTVVASTGKPERRAWLESLGASRVVDRNGVAPPGDAALLKATWAGVVDTVGGATLAAVLRSTRTGGCVTACGLVGGDGLSLTVHPFILRGITLCGIDSALTARPLRMVLWDLLAGAWRPAGLASVSRTVALPDIGPEVSSILSGGGVGRTLVRIAR